VLADGAADAFDVLGAHPYSYPARPDDESTASWNSFVRLPLLRAALVRAGRADAPLWLTEVGAPTGTDDRAVSEAAQAEIVEAAVAAARALPFVERFFAYSLRDAPDGPGVLEANFGLQRSDGRPKPAWDAFGRAIRARR